MASERIFRVADLVELFRQALVAVRPLAEEAGVGWLAEPPYDDADVAMEGLYRSFVISALENSDVAERASTVPNYGFDPVEKGACIGVRLEDRDVAFVRFAGNDPHFMTALCCDPASGQQFPVPWQPGNCFLRLADGAAVEDIVVAS